MDLLLSLINIYSQWCKETYLDTEQFWPNFGLIHLSIDLIVREFTNGSRDLGHSPRSIIPKTQKWYLMPPYLTLRIVKYGSRVSGTIQGKKECSLLHIGVVAIEKGAFGAPSRTAGQLTYLSIYHRFFTFNLFISLFVCEQTYCFHFSLSLFFSPSLSPSLSDSLYLSLLKSIYLSIYLSICSLCCH